MCPGCIRLNETGRRAGILSDVLLQWGRPDKAIHTLVRTTNTVDSCSAVQTFQEVVGSRQADYG